MYVVKELSRCAAIALHSRLPSLGTWLCRSGPLHLMFLGL